MIKEDRFEQGLKAEALFIETMSKCPRVEIYKVSHLIDMTDKYDFILKYKSLSGYIHEFKIDVKSPYSKNPRFVNINHTSRDGSQGTITLSQATFIAVQGKYDALGRLPEPIDVWYFVTKENLWNAITEDMYHKSAYDGSAWYQVPIYGEQYGRMSGEGLAVKRSMFIDMNGNITESQYLQYNWLLR